MKLKKWFIISLIAVLTLSGCANATATIAPSANPPGSKLTPYVTITLTPTATSTPIDAPTATPAPTLSPTPRIYTVKANDTLQVIAFRNGLTLEELIAANPDVNAYLLIVGSTLVIPPPSGALTTPSAQAPTPAGLVVDSAYCISTASSGAYCFATLTNAEPFDVANVSAEFRLTSPASGDVLTKSATLPVSRVTQAATLPLFAYFPPPVFANPQVMLQVQTAMQAGEASTAPVVSVAEPLIEINAGGSSARVSGEAAVAAGGKDAGTLWITAVAFDAEGIVLGVRRWESSQGVNAGASTTFELWVYSTGGAIATIELFTEADS
jgi:LysM repeat protein